MSDRVNPDEERLNEILAAYLEAVDAGTAPPREEFLARHPELAAFLDDDARLRRLASEPETQPAAPSLAVGSRVRYFGDYELVEEIARGGMGVVFKARQVSLDRVVAVKMILAGQLAGEADVARFQAEARAVAKLDHPHIVPIHEVGQHDGQHYFSMKLIEGGNLAAHLPRLRQDLRAGVSLLARAAWALQHAHERGILHRDLKPANILVAAGDEPHLTDFGLAKTMGGSARTASGVIVGTPAYMAPEQARGLKEVTARADVYSLGAILYELMTGRPPFQAPTGMDTLLKVITDEVVAPSRVVPGVDRDLETICLKCLSKEPEGRYSSAADLAGDLERWLRGEPIRARRTGPVERAWRWGKRHPVRLAGVAAALVLVVVGILAWGESRRQERWRLVERRLKEAKDSRDRGLESCKQGAIAEGLLWLARALEQAPEDATDFREETRVSIAGWYRVYSGRRILPETRVGEVQLSPDGRTVLTTLGVQPTFHLLDLTNGKEVGSPHSHPGATWAIGFRKGKLVKAILPGSDSLFDSRPGGHTGEVLTTALSDDGKLLATSSADRTVRLWDVPTGKLVGQPMAYTAPVTYLQFAPGGQRLVTGVSQSNGGHSLQLWSCPDGRAIRKAQGLEDRVFGTAFSPDGRYLVWLRLTHSFMRFCTLALLDAGTGELLDDLSGPGTARAARFSPDGRTLVVLWSETFGVWDLSGKAPRFLASHQLPKEWSKAEFSPGGAFLAVVRVEREEERGEAPLGPGPRRVVLQIWDARSWALLPVAAEKAKAPVVEFFHPDGRSILTLEKDSTLVLRDVRTWKPRMTFGDPPQRLRALHFSPDGKSLLTQDHLLPDSPFIWWDVATGKPNGEPFAVRDMRRWESSRIEFDPQGGKLLRDEYHSFLQLWDARTGTRIGKPLDGSFGVFHPSGRWVLQYHPPVLWDTRTGQQVETRAELHYRWGWESTRPGRKPFDKTQRSTEGLWSPDGRWMLPQQDKNQTTVFSMDGDRLLLVPPPGKIVDAAFHPGGRHLVVASRDKSDSVRLWDIRTGKQVGGSFEASGIKAIRASAGGILAIGNRSLWFLDAPDLKPRWQHQEKNRGFLDATIAPDGRTVVLILISGSILLLDADTGKLRGEPIACHTVLDPEPGRTDAIFPVVGFSPDGRHLLVTSVDEIEDGQEPARAARERKRLGGIARLWDLKTAQPVGQPMYHPRLIDAATFSPDGKLLATASEDGQVWLWDLATNARVGVPLPHEGRVVRLTFAPDGSSLWVSTGTGHHRVWEVAPRLPEADEQVRPWLELRTGKYLDGKGECLSLTEAAIEERRKLLDDAGESPGQ